MTRAILDFLFTIIIPVIYVYDNNTYRNLDHDNRGFQRCQYPLFVNIHLVSIKLLSHLFTQISN
jgi:hypothetical protein